MSYESRAYDRTNDDGFPPDPVVVLVVTGTHDVSRLINLLHTGQPVVEQIQLGEQIRRQVSHHNGGRAALALLRAHGGPDFTAPEDKPEPNEDYTEVVFEVDLHGRRVNLSALNERGAGHGYRMIGPKFRDVDATKVTARHVLDERDVEEIRSYLALWDRIQARKAAEQSADSAGGA